MATVKANLVEVIEPHYLSVVGKPANRTPWRIIRSESGNKQEPKVAAKPASRIIPAKRSSGSASSPVLAMEFALSLTDQQVTERLSSYGLEGYTVSRSEAAIVAVRGDLSAVPTTGVARVKLAEDTTALVQRADVVHNPGSFLSVLSIVLRSEKFTVETAKQWAKDNGIEQEPVVATDGNFVIIRHETQPEQETRTISTDEGVQITVARADVQDIPAGFVASVNECCYGSWGWGQLDFTAAMADEVFSEVMDDAIYTLRRVISNILLQSPLPLAERKSLLANALEQFLAFSTAVLDSLPRTLLVAVARSATPDSISENHMTTKPSGAAPSANSATPTTQAPAAEPAASEEAVVSRAEFNKLLAAVERMAAKVDAPQAEPAAPAQTTQPAATADAVITRAEVAKVVAESVAPVLDAVNKLTAGVTVVRSDTNPDRNAADTGQNQHRKDVWAKRSFLPGRTPATPQASS